MQEQVIADVKTISLGNKQFYKPGVVGDKAVDLRAAQLPGEYRRGALKVDRELGFPQGGPTLRKLESYPQVLDLCFGAYGESSEGGEKPHGQDGGVQNTPAGSEKRQP